MIHANVGATLVVAPGVRAGTSPAPTIGMQWRQARPNLGEIVGAFKSITTHEYMKGVANSGWRQFEKRLWQRNYYEHVIRNSNEWNRIHLYIQGNAAQWNTDEENPDNMP